MRQRRQVRGKTGRRLGFTLVEVTIALGVMAVSLVGILAMFPAAIESAAGSIEETRATHIAKSLLAGFAPPPATSFLLGKNAAAARAVSLASSGEWVAGFNEQGEPVGEPREGGDFAAPIREEGWVYAARVLLVPDEPAEGLTRVEVLVSAPAAAPLENRATYPFVALFRNR